MFFLFIDLNFFLPYSHYKTIRGVAHVQRGKPYYRNSWTFCQCMNFENALTGTAVIIIQAVSPVWINIYVWASPS